MKNTFKVLLTSFVLLSMLTAAARAEDKYAQLAMEITEAGSPVLGKKIAIIPFSYADGRTGATKDGSVIAERLTIKMINMHKFEIIERSVLDKVMTELKLQSSGMIDASSAKQLGKVLGVEAIVTGTLVEMQAGRIEVNARLIKTETAQAIGASQVSVEKDWVGDATTAQQRPVYQETQYQQPVYQQPEYQQPVAKSSYAPRQKGAYEYGYFDIFLGMGSPNMALEFYNSSRGVAPGEVGIAGVGGRYTSIKADNLQTQGFGPIAMRVGGYGNGKMGGAFEFGLERRNVAPQTAAWNFDGGLLNKTYKGADYATVTSFYMAGNLMVRFAKKTPVEPYFGLGLGFSLNAINMPNVSGYTNSTYFSTPTDDFGLGLVFNVPFGLRFNVADKTQLVAELRYQLNTMFFDRGISGESDTITISGAYLNVGVGFDF